VNKVGGTGCWLAKVAACSPSSTLGGPLRATPWADTQRPPGSGVSTRTVKMRSYACGRFFRAVHEGELKSFYPIWSLGRMGCASDGSPVGVLAACLIYLIARSSDRTGEMSPIETLSLEHW